MKTAGHPVTRRDFMVAGRMLAQQAIRIRSRPVAKVPIDPDDSAWRVPPQVTVPLLPQNVVVPRITEAGVKGLRVRSLFDDTHVAFLLEWNDPNRETNVGSVRSFRDAVAIQFPAKGPVTPPFYCMGAPGEPVSIYQWKADWQEARFHDVDETYPNMVTDEYPFSGKGPGEMAEATDYAKAGGKPYITAWAAGNLLADPELKARTSVERLVAEGFGTIESDKTQDGQARGIWKDKGWHIAISVPRAQPTFTFEMERPVPIAFAAWDGSRQERNGQKGFSTWNSLELEVGEAFPTLPVLGGGVGGAIAAALGALLFFRARRMRQRREEG